MSKLLQKLKGHSTEWITNRLLYILVGFAALVFVCFWTIGFEMPDLQDPSVNAPLLTGLLITVLELFVLLAVCVLIWAGIRTLRLGKGSGHIDNGINAWRISLSVAAGTVVVLLLTFLIGSTDPMRINGQLYRSWFWLKASDMFVVSSLILLLAAIACVIFGATRYNRKRKEARH